MFRGSCCTKIFRIPSALSTCMIFFFWMTRCPAHLIRHGYRSRTQWNNDKKLNTDSWVKNTICILRGHDMPHGEAHLPADGSWRALNGNSRKKVCEKTLSVRRPCHRKPRPRTQLRAGFEEPAIPEGKNQSWKAICAKASFTQRNLFVFFSSFSFPVREVRPQRA